MISISESIDTKVIKKYDLIVVGGGIAGVSAALAASRKGLKVLLLERLSVLGGLATAGHIAIYLPLCDGMGHQVTAGIAEELLLLTERLGYSDIPDEWKNGSSVIASGKRYMTVYNASVLALEMERLLINEGVSILYNTQVCKAVVDSGRCTAVIVENIDGRTAYESDFYIDASGDATLFSSAGVYCENSLNHLAWWSYYIQNGTSDTGNRDPNTKSGTNLKLLNIGDHFGGGLPGQADPYDVSTAQGVSEFIIDSHKLAYEWLSLNRSKGVELASLSMMPQIRRSKRIIGCDVLTTASINKHSDTSVGCVSDWRTSGLSYEIPYECLYINDLSNVLAAGRIISAEGDSWEVTRSIPACALTGQSAGTAVVVALRNGTTVQDAGIREIRSELERDGVILHLH